MWVYLGWGLWLWRSYRIYSCPERDQILLGMLISWGIYLLTSWGNWLENPYSFEICLGLYLISWWVPEYQGIKWFSLRYLIPLWFGLNWIAWMSWIGILWVVRL